MKNYTYELLVELYNKGVENVKSGNSDATEIALTKAAGYAADFIDYSEEINQKLTLDGTVEESMNNTIVAVYLSKKASLVKERKETLYKMLSSYLFFNTYNMLLPVLEEDVEDNLCILLISDNLVLSFRSPATGREIRFDVFREVRKLINNNFEFSDDNIKFSLAPFGAVIVEKILKKM